MEWEPEAGDTPGTFVVTFDPPSFLVSSALAAVIPDQHQFVFYLNFEFPVPEERRVETARLITRANWGLLIGNFELDFDDGQLRFKSSVDFSNSDLTDALVSNAILAAMNAVEAFARAIGLVALSGHSAERALLEQRQSSGPDTPASAAT
jgi:hypothetical protein